MATRAPSGTWEMTPSCSRCAVPPTRPGEPLPVRGLRKQDSVRRLRDPARALLPPSDAGRRGHDRGGADPGIVRGVRSVPVVRGGGRAGRRERDQRLRAQGHRDVTGAAARRPVPGVPETWPEEAAGALVRGLGRYLRDVPALDLPPAIRRFRGWRQAALRPHREQLLAALGAPEQRARLLEWLDGTPRMGAEERDVLRMWAERPAGWERGPKDEEADGLTEEELDPGEQGESQVEGDELRRARERVKRARAQARRARAAERSAIEAARKEIDELTQALSDLRARLAHTEEQARLAAEEAQRAAAAKDRELRRARRAEARARAERDRAHAEAKEAKSEPRGPRRRAETAQTARSQATPPPASPTGRPPRRPLAGSPGLVGDRP